MHFERLEIQGFKSFVDRTTIVFKPGITAIIGPNGCGKSNVSDAIRWVLGEQNVRSLRGHRMEDLLFNGSSRRKATGFAEVTLTVDAGDDSLRAYSGQVEISRRLFRTGESEYSINRVPCRLKDIVDLFLDSGLGKGTSSLIEQGKVDLVLNSRPKDRRILIEDAAGIVRYKVKKEEALRHIADTHANLVRIEDRLYELEQQADVLKKQAAKARRYRNEREKLTELEHQYAAWRLDHFDRILSTRTAAFTILKDELLGRESDLSVHNSSLRQLAEQFENLRQEVHRSENQQTRLLRESELALQNKEFAIERIEALIEEGTRFDEDEQRLRERLDEIRWEMSREEDEREVFQEKLEELQAIVDEQQQQLEDVLSAMRFRVSERDERQKEYLRVASRISQKQQQITRLQSLIEGSDREYTRLTREQTTLQDHHDDLLKKQSAEQERRDLLAVKLSSLQAEYDGIQGEAGSLAGEINSLTGEYNTVRAELYRAEARLQSLREMEASFEGFSSGLRNLLEMFGGETGSGRVDLLIDCLHCDPEYLPVVGLALGRYREAVLVPTRKEALEWAASITETERGRVTLIPLDDAVSISVDRPVGLPVLPCACSRLVDLLTFDAGHEGLVRSLLGHIMLVETLNDAFRLAPLLEPGTCFITTDGTILDEAGAIVAGHETDPAMEVFSRKQELALLAIHVGEATHEVERIQQSLEQKRTLHGDLLERGRQAELATQEIRMQVQSSEQELATLDREGKRVVEILEINRLEQERTCLDRETNQQHIRELQLELEVENQSLEQIEDDLATFDAQLEESNRQRDELQETLTSRRIELASCKERFDGIDRAHERIEATHDDVVGQIDRLEVRRVESVEQKARMEKSREEAERIILRTHNELIGLRKAHETLLATHDQCRESVTAQQDKVIALSTEIEPLKERIGNEQLDLRTIEVDLQHLLGDIEQRLHVSAEDLRARDDRPADEEEATRVLGSIEAIHKRLEGYDDINLAAPEEYDALQSRLQGMYAQRNDVQEAIDALQRTVKKIDHESEIRFNDCFQQVSRNFTEVFQRLFEGGFAELLLEDENSLLDTGILINAQPPGKKLQSISLLSGGEKALTAIALLMAIFKYRASSFCFLDEVDAALDEINSQRFSRLLLEIAEGAQIIMITHSRKILEIADVFYGVTMSEPGISSIISLKLENVQEEQQTA